MSHTRTSRLLCRVHITTAHPTSHLALPAPPPHLLQLVPADGDVWLAEAPQRRTAALLQTRDQAACKAGTGVRVNVEPIP